MFSPFLESLDRFFDADLEAIQYVCEECHQTIIDLLAVINDGLVEGFDDSGAHPDVLLHELPLEEDAAHGAEGGTSLQHHVALRLDAFHDFGFVFGRGSLDTNGKVDLSGSFVDGQLRSVAEIAPGRDPVSGDDAAGDATDRGAGDDAGLQRRLVGFRLGSHNGLRRRNEIDDLSGNDSAIHLGTHSISFPFRLFGLSDVFGHDGLCLEVNAGFGAIIDDVNESLVSVGGEYAGIAEAFDDHRPGIVGPVLSEEAPVQFEVLALQDLIRFLSDGGFDLAPGISLGTSLAVMEM